MIFRIKGQTNRHGKKNGSREKTKPGISYRVYCSTCPIPDLQHPQSAPHGSPGGKKFVCPHGHVTIVHS